MRGTILAGVLLGLTVAPDLALAAEPIATTDGEFSGTSLQIQAFKVVSGGTVMMKFTIINSSDSPFETAKFLSSNGGYYNATVDGIYLVDLIGKKKYLVIRDSEKKCLCSDGVANVDPKSSGNYWAKFPAPPDGVTKIGVVVPHFVPMDDVPLSR